MVENTGDGFLAEVASVVYAARHFSDPNGYIIELTASTGKDGEIMDPAISKPHEALARWQATKSH